MAMCDSADEVNHQPVNQQWLNALQLIGFFKRLVHFRLKYSHPISLEDGEVLKLVLACPTLRELHINPEPKFFHNMATNTSTMVLWHLAKHCQNLIALSLFVNVRIDRVCLAASSGMGTDMHSTTRPFSQLKSLCLGLSELEDREVEDVTLLFGLVLPDNCDIYFNPNIGSWLWEDRETTNMVKKRRAAWGAVKAVLPKMLELRRCLRPGVPLAWTTKQFVPVEPYLASRGFQRISLPLGCGAN